MSARRHDAQTLVAIFLVELDEAVLQPLAGLSITLDAYQIDVDDRIGLSTAFELTPAQR